MVSRTSLWWDRRPAPAHPHHLAPGADPHPADEPADVVVVGAGLTGLTTALLLTRAGLRVLVLEARAVGAGTTGRSTAKISLLQGDRLASLAEQHDDRVAAAYAEGSAEGMDWLLRYLDDHDVPYQRREAVTFATTADGRDRVEAELEAARRAGVPVGWRRRTDLPLPVTGAIGLADQAQVDPLDVLGALAADVVARGGRVVEGVRVLGMHHGRGLTSRTGRAVLRTTAGDVTCDAVVLATGTPILDRGGAFARLHALRSYALAFRVPEPPPASMAISVDAETRSIRSTPAGADGPDVLLVGGAGHPVGRRVPTGASVRELLEWTHRHVPGAELTHVWSAQDYAAADGLPLVGRLLPLDPRLHVATGYAKWGMTTAVAASLVLAAELLGDHPPRWAEAWRPWGRHEVAGLGEAVRLNAGVGRRLAGGWTAPRPAAGRRPDPPEGQGGVERAGVRPEAVCTVGGVTRRFSAVCPHLGGVVTWNEVERSFDCPLHGSRFAADGSVLEGPATHGLAPR
ncbi:FAD-dependent oxidoreductase [Cellulomonas hominis]|uniref:FAD-dependent oxidoreductase n=1 Tax=Cellulomonas hominis TaxID=156981 RepID=UPI001C10AB80|nr:FAD-dependent oxidoreductase [Cellulomonas hominis]MBU5421770.1 FAD-dependent oxidoreductase [Cellulomonas hominis]